MDDDALARLRRKVGERVGEMHTGGYYVDTSTGWEGVWGGGAANDNNGHRTVGLIQAGPKGAMESRQCVDKFCVEPDKPGASRRR